MGSEARGDGRLGVGGELTSARSTARSRPSPEDGPGVRNRFEADLGALRDEGIAVSAAVAACPMDKARSRRRCNSSGLPGGLIAHLQPGV